MIGKIIFTGLKVPSANSMYRRNRGPDKKTSPQTTLKNTIENLTDGSDIQLIEDKKIFLRIKFERKSNRKFDLDNCLKSIIDCLQGVLYKDDDQIYALFASKEVGCPENIVTIDYETLKDD